MLEMNRIAKCCCVLIALLVGCSQPSAQPTSRVAKRDTKPVGPRGELVVLSDFAHVAKAVLADVTEDHIETVYVSGFTPVIRLTVTTQTGGDKQTLYSTLLAIPPNHELTHGYVVLQVPTVSKDSRDKELRLTLHAIGTSRLEDEQKKIELAVPLGSILSDEILAMAPGRVNTSFGYMSSGGKTIVVSPTVSFYMKDSKTSLNFTALVSRPPASKPLAEQAAELSSDGVFYRGWHMQYARATDDGGIDVSFDDARPTGFFRYERTSNGHTVASGNFNLRSTTAPDPGVWVRVVQLSSDSVTFEVVARLGDRIVHADLLEVPVDKTAVFWIQPRVAYFHEPDKPPVGIAVHVFSKEP